MDNIINPNGNTVKIDGNLVIKDFFDNFFNRIVVKVFLKVYPAEEREIMLDGLYQEQFNQFEAIFKDLQMHDLGGYLKLKGAIESSYQQIKNTLCKEAEKNDETIR